jgi:prepilin-type N-terminal cleavage/methylation domain-containing protein
MVSRGERGESLIELMVAIAIMSFVLLGTFGVVRHLLDLQTQFAQRHADYAQIEALAGAWETESRTAEAITVPAPATCPEVEFFSRDPNGSTYHAWSYRWDAAAQTLTRYASNSGALVPCSAASGKVVATGITAFTARRRAADSLATSPDAPYVLASGVNAAAPPLGIQEADATTNVTGGNTIVEIAITGPQSQRTIELLPGIAPSGYTLALQYTCNARCNPSAPHDGSRVNQCASSYRVTTAYATQSVYVTPGSRSPMPAAPPNAEGTGFYFPLAWSITGQLAFTYTGRDTSVTYDDFTILVPSDPADPNNNYYPKYIAPVDPVATADEIVANYGGGVFAANVLRDIAACDAMAAPVPVFQND